MEWGKTFLVCQYGNCALKLVLGGDEFWEVVEGHRNRDDVRVEEKGVR